MGIIEQWIRVKNKENREQKIFIAPVIFDGEIVEIKLRMPNAWYDPDDREFMVMQNVVWTTSSGSMISKSSCDDIHRGFLNFEVNPSALRRKDEDVIRALVVVDKFLAKCKVDAVAAGDGC